MNKVLAWTSCITFDNDSSMSDSAILADISYFVIWSVRTGIFGVSPSILADLTFRSNVASCNDDRLPEESLTERNLDPI